MYLICKHRFQDKLIPDWPVKYLFVGTFNPAWNGGNDAKYFYGRLQNKFWEIMPLALGLQSQIENREKPALLEKFLRAKNIGLTDLILGICGANENDISHRKSILSFKDDELLRFKIIFNEKIYDLIDRNVSYLRDGGVFLTRKTMPLGSIGVFWKKIEEFCRNKGVRSARLISPSLRFRTKSIKTKIKEWKTTIDNR